jgi:hypothetical protein
MPIRRRLTRTEVRGLLLFAVVAFVAVAILVPWLRREGRVPVFSGILGPSVKPPALEQTVVVETAQQELERIKDVLSGHSRMLEENNALISRLREDLARREAEVQKLNAENTKLQEAVLAANKRVELLSKEVDVLRTVRVVVVSKPHPQEVKTHRINTNYAVIRK